jgi:hypothetical protein
MLSVLVAAFDPVSMDLRVGRIRIQQNSWIRMQAVTSESLTLIYIRCTACCQSSWPHSILCPWAWGSRWRLSASSSSNTGLSTFLLNFRLLLPKGTNGTLLSNYKLNLDLSSVFKSAVLLTVSLIRDILIRIQIRILGSGQWIQGSLSSDNESQVRNICRPSLFSIYY